jgi:phosphotransferase system HPr (HPr) family protein
VATSLELDVRNPSGLHARPAAVFVRAACTFQSEIQVENLTTGSPPVTAKSIIGVLSLGVLTGHRIRVRVDGEDEEPASAILRSLVESGLGEPIDGEAGATPHA